MDVGWCSWSSASICAERRAWSAVAAGEARSRSKVGIIACMRRGRRPCAGCRGNRFGCFAARCARRRRPPGEAPRRAARERLFGDAAGRWAHYFGIWGRKIGLVGKFFGEFPMLHESSWSFGFIRYAVIRGGRNAQRERLAGVFPQFGKIFLPIRSSYLSPSSWSKLSICAERRAWSAVAAGEARSRSKVGIIAFMRAWPSSVRRLSGKQVWMICSAM